MKKKLFLFAVIFFISTAFTLLLTIPHASAAGDIIRVSTYGVGTTGHAIVTGMAHAIKEKTGMKMFPVPRETEAGRFLSVRARDAEFAFTTDLSVSAPMAGIVEFAGDSWGPQKVYRVWMGPNRAGWIASAKSGIKYLKDVKGKKVGSWPGSGRIAIDAMLAYAGLTRADVNIIDFPSFGSTIRAAMTGKTDLWWLGLYAGYTLNIAGKPQGAWVVDMPINDIEAWEKMREIAPFFSQWHYENLPGKNQTADSLSYPYCLYTYPWLSDELAYTVTKAMWEGYDLYKGKHPELQYFTREYAVDLKYLPRGWPPYHPGSVKFFKEAGAWTPKHEEWQQFSMKLADAREKAWKEARAIGAKKRMRTSSTDWQEFWEDYLASYLASKGLPATPAMKKK